MIEPCLETEIVMERLRRDSRTMSRAQLLVAIDSLTRLYGSTKAACKWLASGAHID